MLNNIKGSNGKVLLAALAGATAGIVAGLLMAPDRGEEMRISLRRAARRIGDDLDRTMKDYMDRIGGGTFGSDSLVMKGNWDDVKGRLKQRYANLTEDDLVYAEGSADELLGRLKTKLGMSKKDLRRMIEEI